MKNKTNNPQVKICGLTRIKDAVFCVENKVDAIGCVFYPKSPRYLTDIKAKEICLVTRGTDVTSVGVFVNASFSFIMKKTEKCLLKALQLHGNESPSLVKRLLDENLTVIKAFFLKDEPFFEKASTYTASAILLECGGGILPGGNAKSWDWQIAKELGKNHPVVLAGGLTVGNISRALIKAAPDAVDVSSGVESIPGIKDPQKIKTFMDAVTQFRKEKAYKKIF